MDKSIYNQQPTHVYWKDAEGRMLGLNSIDGTDASALIGLKDDELPWSGDFEGYRRHDLEVMEKKERIAFIEFAKDEEGNLHEFVSIKSPLRNEKGKVIGVTGISFPKSMIEDLKK
jgi:hypothetical protein